MPEHGAPPTGSRGSTVPAGTRALAIATSAGLAGFAVLAAEAMRRYPGGTWRDHASIGHRFWENYCCDLASPVTVAGIANPSAVWGQAAMLVFALSLVPFWLAVARRARSRGLARAVAACGIGGAVVAACVPLTAGDHGLLHGAASLAAGGLGTTAMMLAVWVGRRRRRQLVTGLLALASSTVVAAVYLDAIVRGGEPAALPPLQKAAAIFLGVWMLTAAWQGREVALLCGPVCAPNPSPSTLPPPSR